MVPGTVARNAPAQTVRRIRQPNFWAAAGELRQPIPERHDELSQLLKDEARGVDLAFSRFAVGGLEPYLELQRLSSSRDERDIVELRFVETPRALGWPVRESRRFGPTKGCPQFYEGK
jgi:hypothetical protein